MKARFVVSILTVVCGAVACSQGQPDSGGGPPEVPANPSQQLEGVAARPIEWVECEKDIPRPDTPVDVTDSGETITTEYVQIVFPADAYDGDRSVMIKAHARWHGVNIAPPPHGIVTIRLRRGLCEYGNSLQYWIASASAYRSARNMSNDDGSWAEAAVPGSDFEDTANLLLLGDTAEANSIRGGWVILSN